MGGPSVARPSHVRSKTWDKGTRALVPKGEPGGGTQPTIPEAGCDAYPCEPSRELPYSVPFKHLLYVCLDEHNTSAERPKKRFTRHRG